MTNITVSLPDDLALQAQSEGLLRPEALERLLRAAMRQRQSAAQHATGLSEASLTAIWNNPEDADYDRL